MGHTTETILWTIRQATHHLGGIQIIDRVAREPTRRANVNWGILDNDCEFEAAKTTGAVEA